MEPAHAEAAIDPANGRVQALAARFFAWRAAQQPRCRDDIPRVERPIGWLPRWTAESVRRYRRSLTGFERDCALIATGSSPVPVQVDHRLVASAIARVRWELDLLQLWQRHPGFYVDQSLGTVFDLLLTSGPVVAGRAEELLLRLGAVPSTLATGLANVASTAVPEFARLTVDELADIGDRVLATSRALRPLLVADQAARLPTLAGRAARALEDYREAVRRLPPNREPAAVGRDAFRFFLSRVALLPYSPEELTDIGSREYERAVALEAVESLRNPTGAAPTLPADAAAQAADQRRAEAQVRDFYERRDLLTLPAWLRRYRTVPMPDHLVPLAWLGVTDDLTSPTRLGEDAVSYLPPPGPELPFFHHANAVDPRLGIIHEGAHHQQLALAWAGPDPVRRHYYDSAANEGIAFYNEELMLASGLLDGHPAARRIAYAFMRLRALRVEVDVGLASGAIDVDTAAATLAQRVPLDDGTARQEAAFFAATPGQGLSYQIGKAQVMRLVAGARIREGDRFRLRHLHDYLWTNGNVPLALLRWEYLGLRDDLDRVDAIAARGARPVLLTR